MAGADLRGRLFGGRAIPPMTEAVTANISDADHLRAVIATYYGPEMTYPCGHGYDDRHFRVRDDITLIVANNGRIIGFGSPVQPLCGAPSEKPSSGAPIRRRRGKGGSGTRIPTSFAELLARARAAGATVVRSGRRHTVLELPDHTRVVLPTTPSDWRALPNSVSLLRRRGLDVRRPVRGAGT